MNKMKFDAIYLGIVTGLVVPLVMLIFFYFFRNIEESFINYLQVTFKYAILSKLISLAAIPDALLFFVFLWTDKFRSAKGVIFSLFIICLIVILLKLVS